MPAPKPYTIYRIPSPHADVYVRTMGPAGLVTDEGVLVHPVDGLPNLLHVSSRKLIDGRPAATYYEAERLYIYAFRHDVVEEVCADEAWQTP